MSDIQKKIQNTKKFISEKIQDKKFVLYFFPKKLEYLLKSKKIKYQYRYNKSDDSCVKEVNLQSDKLISILSFFITMYYRSGKDKLYVSSTEFQKRYGDEYKAYIQYFLENGILDHTGNYSKGNHSNIYSLKDEYRLKGNTTRIKCYSKVRIKNWIKIYVNKIGKSILSSKIINPLIVERMINYLYHVELDFDNAMNKLDEIYKNGEISDTQYIKNLMDLEQFHYKEIYHTTDNYGRFHTNLTTMKKLFRNGYLKIDGEDIAELDIDNSQPLLLSTFMKQCGIEQDSYYAEEFEKFNNLVKNNKFYQYLMDELGITKKQAKEYVFVIFFGKNFSNDTKPSQNNYDPECDLRDIENKIYQGCGSINRNFKNLFPRMYSWIYSYKFPSHDDRDKKRLFKKLQAMESELVYNNICGYLIIKYPHIKFFTVHDSIYFPKKYYKEVEEIFTNQLEIYIS